MPSLSCLAVGQYLGFYSTLSSRYYFTCAYLHSCN